MTVLQRVLGTILDDKDRRFHREAV